VRHSAGRHVLVVAAVGVIAGVLAGLLFRAAIGPMVGFDAAALSYLGYMWLLIWPLDADGTAAHATREDPSRALADLALLLAAVASLAGVGVLMAQSHSSHGSVRSAEIGISVASVAASWLLVHTIFTLKYARLYYDRTGNRPERGVDFENNVRPPYSDFAYLAFTIGMTFQVSDTDLQTAEYRRLALRHALLSYLFGAVVLAATVNLVAGLAS
jgi:uncharacterized membrane protein